MYNSDDKITKKFVTNLYPNTKVIVDGSCEFIIQKINSHGQIEFSFLINRSTKVETYKLKKIDIDGNK